jgi:glycogen(starch) synthase
MKVLMFGWEFPPHISGGLGTACYGLSKGLVSFSDIDLTFVVPKKFGGEDISRMQLLGASDVELSGKTLLKHRESESKESYTFESHISAYTTPELYEKQIREQKEKLSNTIGTSSSGRLEFSGKYGSSLFEEISRYSVVASELAGREHYDVIHAHDWLTYPAGIEASKVLNKPLVVHVHATEFDRCGDNLNKRVFEIERKGMEIAHKVITVSEFTRNTVINKYNIDPSKVVTIHNAVEPISSKNIDNTWKIGTNDKIVTYLGRITRQKGPEYFVEAAWKVLQKMNNVRFVMAGSGDLMEQIIKQVARLKISNKFHFTGFLKGEDVYRMYTVSDLYVMPSVSEPFGISPLEAIQSNVPVIISKQSGVSEVINNAIKVDYWDINAMADAIYGILNYKPLANYLRNYSKKEIDFLTWANVAKKVKDVYYEIA